MADALRSSGFFVLRAPLLPWEELDRLRADSRYPQRLAALPAVAEALYLASPALMRRWVTGDSDPRMTAAITAYLVRMCSRPTPFGLFASCSTGVVADTTALRVDGPDGTVRHSRPDTEVLATLVEKLLAEPQTRARMLVEPNSSRYRAAGAWRIVDSRTRDGYRSHHLVVVEDDAPLRSALKAASGGATVEQVVEAVEADTGAGHDEVRDYVDDLVDAQVLTAVAEPAVTGPEPLAHVTNSLRRQGFTQTVAVLDRVGTELAGLDAAGLGNPPDAYHSLSGDLLELAGGGEESRLIQVDLHRAGSGLTLGRDVVRQLAEGVTLLHRLSPADGDASLRRFKEAFRARYEDRAVPLMEALDEEMGVGFDPSRHPAADQSPLLAGIDLGGFSPERSFTTRDSVLLDLLIRTRDSGAESLELDAGTVARLATDQPLPLPDALAVTATVLDEGIELHYAHGPSGAQLLGRFCHGDIRLQDAVRAHLRAEEAHAPGVVFAEVVHLPEGRTGNILARPVLRDYELVLLGGSGAPADRQLCVDELTVRLEGERLVLHSARLDAEVRPRLTTAHNTRRGFGVYRFLAALQDDGVAGNLGWDWGALSGAPTLPRVTAGRLVLSRARWGLNAAELSTLTTADAATGWAALAAERGIPAQVLIADGDNRLYLDTASPALVAAAAKILRGRTAAIVEEVLPSRIATGPQGHFAHELIVPFLRDADPVPARRRRQPPRVRRTFPPGSEWLYLKAYTGTASGDQILTGTIGPVLEQLRQARIADQWFFLRYADPDHHLRVRLHGDPAALREHALPALTAALNPQIDEGTVWKVVLDTYDREIERYGGDTGITVAERIHAADSHAVLRVLDMLDDQDAGLDARWKLCLYATDRLLADAGLTLTQRRDWAKTGAAGYRREYPNAPNLESGIARRWRAERAGLTTLLDDSSDHPYEPARQVFRERSEQATPLLAELVDLDRRGFLTVPPTQLLYSFNHLHAIRLLRSAARTHELILHGFLDRYYASRIAQAPLI
jgi:thiopeptide-type bacteriocin biosynthesis protein